MEEPSRSSGPSTDPPAAAEPGAAGPEQIDWARWMRALGRQERRAREFLGLSQEQLARLAGVSQGAVSRLEAGRGLATPMLVVLKINLALRRAIRTLDPAILNDDLRRILDIEERLSPPAGDIGFNALPLTRDPNIEELVRLYRQVPERQRQALLAVARATARALVNATPAEGGEKA